MSTPPITLWSNPRMKYCPYRPSCNFCDEDEDVIAVHVAKVHTEELRAQAKLDGSKVTEDDRRAALLAKIPQELLTCPYCFTIYQNATVVRFFTDGGTLSTKAMCRKAAGGCGHTMMLDSMRKVRQGPREHGRFLGTIGGKLWIEKVDHDKFIPALKKLYPRVAVLEWDSPLQPLNQFWVGYGESRPEWAEKQRERKALKDYEESFKGQPASDQVDEAGLMITPENVVEKPFTAADREALKAHLLTEAYQNRKTWKGRSEYEVRAGIGGQIMMAGLLGVDPFTQNTSGYDFLLDGMRIDSKCRGLPGSSFVDLRWNSVLHKEDAEDEDVDGYAFSMLNLDIGTWWGIGRISRTDFMELSTECRKGEPWPDNPQRFVKEDCRILPYELLWPLTTSHWWRIFS